MSLERLVRPFQSPVFSPRVLQPQSALPDVPEDGVISIVGKSDGKYNEGPSPGASNFSTNESYTEDRSGRVTEQVRVANPDDESQYVMVERMKAAKFKNERTGDEMSLNFGSWGG